MKTNFAAVSTVAALTVATLAAGTLAFAPTAHAKVPQVQADRLGADLTPMGSEKAGTETPFGDIPAWTGGLTTIPEGVSYDPNDPLPNPFASDPVLFTVNKGNMDTYADYLTDAYKEILSYYDGYFMNVKKSRRSCAFPEKVYEANKRNATVGELVGEGNGVGKAIMGFPFPIPNNALEIIWNHNLRYRSFKVTRQFASAPVTRSGEYTLTVTQDQAIIPWADPTKDAAEDLNNISIYYIMNTIAPTRSAGQVTLVHDSINAAAEPRKAWQYSPGTRRVRRAPDIAYDNPGTNSDGLSTSDAFDGFNGAPDRYNWTVRGVSPKIVAFNDYQAQLTPYEEYLQPLHLNQDKVRYEMHRVWTIEAVLKPDMRHIYSRRVKHLLADDWTIANTELYDGRGEMWRIQEIHGIQRYNVPLCNSGTEVVYDMQAGRYFATGMQNEEPAVNYFADELEVDTYTPGAIRQLGVR